MSQKQALILDDDLGNRQLLRFVLERNGYAIRETSLGSEAWEHFAPGRYTLACVDIKLPDQSGLSVARRMRSLDPAIVLLVATIDDDDATVRNSAEAGCDAFVVKPYDLERLMAFVRTLDPAALRAGGQLVRL